VDEANRPFAEVALTVLRTLGGRYRTLADRLATSLRRQPLRTLQREPMPVRTLPPQRRRAQAANPGPALRGPGDVPVGTHRRVLTPGETVTTPTQGTEGSNQRPINQPTVWGDVPPRNPNFTGRHQLLTALRQQLTSKVTALLPHTLHGLGGVGKTQLAVEYVYRFAGEYDVVWWVPSEQPSQIRQSMLTLAPRLGLNVSPGDDLAQTLTAIDDALRLGRPYRRWLLVFDNADRADDLKPFLSNPTGHILITSRNRSWGNVAETVEVDVFEREESIELLTRRLPAITVEEADKLAEKLGDLPLALEQAAAWQAATATPAMEYLQLLEDQVGTLMSESKPSDYPEPVAAAWGLAFNQLTERTPAALQLLELCAFLSSEPISVRLLRDGRHISLPTPLADVVRDDIQMRRAIRDISRYGLAKVDSSRNSLQVHRLVQAVLRDRLSDEQQTSYRALAHALLSAANQGDPDDQETWGRHAELATHVGPAGLVDGETADIRKVVLDQIRYQYLLGDFESSRELAEVALTEWRRRLGNDDEQALIAGRMLGNALRSLGRIEEARVLNEEIYARSRSVFGANHEHTLVMANSMGADLRLRGEWLAALELDREMFDLHVQVFDENDSSTLLSANNLAVDHRLLGRFQEALDVDTDTRDRLVRVLGAEHPYTLRIMSNMSRDYYGLGDYYEAIALQRRSLPAHRAVLGRDHFEVLRATRIHVVTLRKIGSLAEAAELAEDLVATSTRRLGEQHPDSMFALMTQSNCLAALKQPQRAKVAGEDALARMSDVLGAEHPFTYAAMTNLATILRGMGDYGQARSLDEQAVRGFERRLDAHHSYALCTRMNLANDIAVDHDHARAYELGQEILAGMVALFGPTHPQTLVCTLNLSIDLSALGRSDEAREMHDQVVSSLEESLGAEHPETVSAQNNVRASIEIEPPNP
jgi:tetratricopeptide (TPR) repeat protein